MRVVTIGDAPTASLSEQAYSELRRRIVDLTIAPGALITEAQLAADLGVGKTPAREALRRIASEGFAEPSRRGYIVAPVTIASAIEIFDAMSVIVPQVAAMVAERSMPEQKAEIRRRVRDWEHGSPDGGLPWGEFIALTGNRQIMAMANGLVGHVERVLTIARREGAFDAERFREAERVAFDALESADRETVRAVFQSFTTTGRDAVVGALQASASLMHVAVEIR